MTTIPGVSQYLQKLTPFSPTSAARNTPAKTDEQVLKVAVQEFEAMFIAEILKAAGRTDMSGDLFGTDRAMQIYRDMRDESFASEMASAGGLGIGNMLYQELQKGM